MIVSIKKLSDINFVEIDPENDEFHMDSGDIYTFTSHVCHNCWDGGTVLKEIKMEKLYCLRCEERLKWITLQFQTSNETRPEPEKFLLPLSWDKEKIDVWLKEFQHRRDHELDIRENMLHSAEGGDYL